MASLMHASRLARWWAAPIRAGRRLTGAFLDLARLVALRCLAVAPVLSFKCLAGCPSSPGDSWALTLTRKRNSSLQTSHLRVPE